MNHPLEAVFEEKESAGLQDLRSELKNIRDELSALRSQLDPISEPPIQKPKRRSWASFSLRAFLVLLTFVSIYAAWLGAEWRASKAERQVGEELARQNFTAQWTPTESLAVGVLPGRTNDPPQLLVRWFGSELFRDLTSLSLSSPNQRGSRQSVDSFFDNVKHLRRLKELRIQNIPLDNSDLAKVFQLSMLESLDLSLTGLAEGSIQGIQDLRLRYFDGSHTWIDDQAAKDISECDALLYLNLSRTRVTDACLDDLKHMKSLRQLVVERTRITPEGVAAFAKAMPHVYIQYQPLIMKISGRVDLEKSRSQARNFGKKPVYSMPDEYPVAPMQNRYWPYLKL